MTFALAIGVGLIPTTHSKRGRMSVGLITFGFLITAFASAEEAPWAAPLYVVTFAITGTLAAVNELSASPLLIDEPYWTKVGLFLVHSKKVRAAATRGSQVESSK